MLTTWYLKTRTATSSVWCKRSGVLAFTLVVVGGASVDRPARSEPSAQAPTPAPSVRTFIYKTAGACQIKADVHRLPGNEVRPVIIWIHGGALIFGGRGSVKDHQLQRYLRAGYAVVSIDYRLAPETKLPAIIEDLQDAYRWAREQGPQLFQIDPDRVAVVGDSAGGYLTLMAGFAVTPRPKALVSFYVYGDITGPWTSHADPHYGKLDLIAKKEAYGALGGTVCSESPIFPRVTFYNYCRQNGLWLKEVAGLDPDKDRATLEQFCPVRHVTREFPPTLLLHGDKDTDVPFEQSELMAAALKEQQVPSRLITMKNYDHLFDVFPEGWPSEKPPTELKDPKVLAAFDEVMTFLTDHVSARE
jgi:acetyl esterase/lipase